jgi:hypothetical protein
VEQPVIGQGTLQLDWLDAAREARKRGTRGLLADTPRARRSDPDPSHQAAEDIRKSGQLGWQQRTVLEAVKAHPGSTSAELGQLIAHDRSEDVVMWRYRVARRLPELSPTHVRRGAPRQCERTGRPAGVWYPVR